MARLFSPPLTQPLNIFVDLTDPSGQIQTSGFTAKDAEGAKEQIENIEDRLQVFADLREFFDDLGSVFDDLNSEFDDLGSVFDDLNSEFDDLRDVSERGQECAEFIDGVLSQGAPESVDTLPGGRRPGAFSEHERTFCPFLFSCQTVMTLRIPQAMKMPH